MQQLCRCHCFGMIVFSSSRVGVGCVLRVACCCGTLGTGVGGLPARLLLLPYPAPGRRVPGNGVLSSAVAAELLLLLCSCVVALLPVAPGVLRLLAALWVATGAAATESAGLRGKSHVPV